MVVPKSSLMLAGIEDEDGVEMSGEELPDCVA